MNELKNDQRAAGLAFLPAKAEDASLLSRTAFDAKRHWGYTDEQMSLWTDELIIRPEYILRHHVLKLYGGTDYLGFTALIAGAGTWDIDHLWLLPGQTGRGYGRRVFSHLRDLARLQGAEALRVCAEPNATGFYEKMKGELIAREESRIKDRFLATYLFKL